MVPQKKAADFFSVQDESDKSGDERDSQANAENDVNSDRDQFSEEEHDEVEDLQEESRTGAFKRTFDKIEADDDDYEQEKNEEESLDVDEEDEEDGSDKKRNKKMKILSKEELEKQLKDIEKTGVMYISRIPPYMQPAQLRKILSRFGEVNRIFMAPEDPKVRAKRIKYGGNRKRNFTEGWAEFTKKKNAKLAAETLNGNKIGGKKRSFYYDDILSVKYLKKFKWHNLTEQVALENQSRHEKLKAEISQATRENKSFIENVGKSKMIQGIQEKRRAMQAESNDGSPQLPEMRRTFEQRKVSSKRAGRTPKVEVPEPGMSKILSKIF